MIPENFEKSLLPLSLDKRLAQIALFFQGQKLVFSTSFGQEDQAITHAIASQKLAIEIFTLDTGRQFQESYDLIDLSVKKLEFNLTTYFPQKESVEELVAQKG
jgi:phosphoadenosine phosphosulfate reductase